MDYKVRLTAALPKGGNGWDHSAIAEALGRPRIEQRAEQPRVALIVYGTRNAEVSKDHTVTAVLEILLVQPVQSEDGRRVAETMLADEYAYQSGGAMLPFELASLIKATFADMPRTPSQIDELEREQQDTMSPTDELRRHLERVHGRDDAAAMTALEAEHRHEADHAGDLPEVLDHLPTWIGWTRADIEAATSDEDAGHGDLPMNTEDRIVAVLEDGEPDDEYGRDRIDADMAGDGNALFSDTPR